MHRPLSLMAAAAAMSMATTVIGASPAAAAPIGDSYRLRDAVEGEQIRRHLKAFKRIAQQNDGTRASGTSGYQASVDYVARKLEAAGYDVRLQEFPFFFFQELSPAEFQRISPDPTTYTLDTDFASMEFSGSGDVTGELVPAKDNVEPPGATANTSNAGCEPADFDPAPADPAVALVQRGTCTFLTKATNAAAAGYDAVIIYNEGQPGRTDAFSGTLGAPVAIPVIGASYSVGSDLLQRDASAPVTVRVRTETTSEERTTSNVLADSPAGRADRTVVVGAHLDSVLGSSSANDNGSGSAIILEIALQMARLGIVPENRLRFAFWGAEESGLVGSEYYVASLSPEELAQTELNLNIDMVASPNYVRFVYDGDGSDSGLAGPEGSGEIESVLAGFFAEKGLASDPTALTGSSDYAPFAEAGVPVGGLFGGAEGVKTEEQAATYGGLAGVAYDPCYHGACDAYGAAQRKAPDLDTALYQALNDAYIAQFGKDKLAGNINVKALNEMSNAAAHAVYYYAMNPVGAGAAAPQSAAAAAGGAGPAGAEARGEMPIR